MCTLSTKTIYLAWKSEPHKERHVIGELSCDNGKCVFKYSQGDVIDRAKKEGFEYYPAFQDLNKVYDENVLETFSQRLPDPRRTDYYDFLKYWHAEYYKSDVFAVLALTGAKLSTDGFEFIAPHDESPAVFYTELAGFVHHATDELLKRINIGDTFQLMMEPENKYDPYAVKVLFENKPIGYIRKIHANSVFNALKNNLNVSAKLDSIVANGNIKKMLLKIEISLS